MLALEVLRGDHAVFFPEYDYGRDPFAIYVLALSTALLWSNVAGHALAYRAGQRPAWFLLSSGWGGSCLGKMRRAGATSWRGLFVGGVSAGLMAVSVAQTHMARASYNKVTFMPMLLVLCLGLLWQGWGQRSWRRVALAGICAGLLPYTYKAAWVHALLVSALRSDFSAALWPCRQAKSSEGDAVDSCLCGRDRAGSRAVPRQLCSAF